MVKQIKWWKMCWLMLVPLMLLLASCTVSLQEEIPPDMPASVTSSGPINTLPGPGDTGVPVPGDGSTTAPSPDVELPPPDATQPDTGSENPPAPTDGTTDSADATDPHTTPQEDVIHTVQRGETLGTIAQQYDVTVDEIAAANNIANVNVITVGDELIIPLSTTGSGDGSTDTDSADTAPKPTPDPTQDTIYIVKPGDNLYRIALNNGLTVDELAAYNGITNVNVIEVGQEIRIPAQ
jgi:LysM repeat protein